jgi:hypothetical protein
VYAGYAGVVGVVRLCDRAPYGVVEPLILRNLERELAESRRGTAIKGGDSW